MMQLFRPFAILAALLFTLVSCEKILPPAPPENELLDGPIEGLTDAERRRFLRGDVAFNEEIFTSETGLGPLFVATSCGSCHAGDGKGTPFSTLTRFGQTDETGNRFLHAGGPQLQHRALPGFLEEKIPNGAAFSRFTPPANTGLGYLERVADADILALADPSDADGDGISGVPNYIVLPGFVEPLPFAAPRADGRYVARFGKKAAAHSLLHQTVNAYNQDMGIVSTFDPFDTFSGEPIDPEVSDQTVRDVVFYLQTLKSPLPRRTDAPEVQRGQQVFSEIQCAACHRPTLKTGESLIAVLSNREFRPFTDLLLHDMGAGLDDGYTEGSALSSEWRTPPLWGLGLSPASQGGRYFLLHDGRAQSIEEAILMHGGEAAGSRERYQNLVAPDKSALLEFLESL